MVLETLQLKRMVNCGLICYNTFKDIVQLECVKIALKEVGIEEIEV